jgi:hypothetical protein
MWRVGLAGMLFVAAGRDLDATPDPVFPGRPDTCWLHEVRANRATTVATYRI